MKYTTDEIRAMPCAGVPVHVIVIVGELLAEVDRLTPLAVSALDIIIPAGNGRHRKES